VNSYVPIRFSVVPQMNTYPDWPFRIFGEYVEQYYVGRAPRLPGLWTVPSGSPDTAGYLLTSWVPKKNRQFMRLHQVNWITHNGPVPDDLEIDHIDGNKSNWALSNLRTITHKANIHAAIDRLGDWFPRVTKLAPHQVDLVLAIAANLPKGQGPLQALADRWGVSKFYLGNLRAQAKKKDDPRYLAGL